MNMSSKRLQHIAACTLASLVLTTTAVLLDLQRAGVHQTIDALKLARQVASQAEGMVLKARESGEKDPVGWVVSYLAQGVEPRLMRVSRVRAEDAQNIESYAMDRDGGTFEYTRILMPENGTGVHIQISQSYVGFLGAQSTLASDFLAFAFFAICLGLSFLGTGRYFGFDDTGRLRRLVAQWVASAKAQLTRHGSHIREMVRESQRLAVSSARARDHVTELRAQIHASINGLHDSRSFYQEGESIAARAESLALNMAIEANRLGGDARRIADMATELHRSIQALHAVNRKGQALVQSVERQVEPWAMDADLAFHAFDEVRDATQLLGTHIRSTTESLLTQAKLIQGLNRELDPAAAQATPAHAPPSEPAQVEAKGGKAGASGGPTTALTIAGQPRGLPRLPDPLPPIDDKASKQPRIARKLKILGRKIRQRKSAA
jgi:hypothetical protein